MEQQVSTSVNYKFGSTYGKLLAALVLLAPIIFFPSQVLTLYSVKVSFLALAAVLVMGVLLAHVLTKGTFSLVKEKYLIPLAIFPIVALVSSFVSGLVPNSIAGLAFDLGTSGSLLMLVILFFLAAFSVSGEGPKVRDSIWALTASSAVAALYVIIRALLGGVLPDAVASRLPNFLVGGSIDTAILLSVGMIAALALVNNFALGKKIKIGLYVFLAVSLLFVGAVGFLPILIMLGLFSLFYFVYTYSWSTADRSPVSKRASFESLIVLVIVVVFILSQGALSQSLSQVFKLNTIEVRPNTEATLSLVGKAYKQNPVLGVGPNNFGTLWNEFKPIEINATQFWLTTFNFGSGFVPTLFATTGGLGSLTLLAFMILFAVSGFRTIFKQNDNPIIQFATSTSFLIALFLWIAMVVYVPSLALVALAFIFSGIYTSLLVHYGKSTFGMNIFSSPKSSFLAVFCVVVLLVASIAGGYFVWERSVASLLYNQASASLSKGDVVAGKANLTKALSLVPTDAYWRAYAEISFNELGQQLAKTPDANKMTEADKAAVQSSIAQAVTSARNAIAWNNSDFENWFTLGRVYEILAANGIEGAVENSRSAYAEALKRAPTNPAILLAEARLEMLANKEQEARAKISKAIELKNNYTDAYYTLAQLEAATNNAKGAIDAVAAASFVDPTNTGLLFQLGVMKYNVRDFAGARDALGRAIQLVPDYANARYFLALSLEKLGDKEGTLRELREIQKTNPDNKEVAQMIQNVEANRPAVPQPAATNIEKKTTAPIKETR